MSSLPTKPKYGSPCNYCGKCCMASLCPVGRQAFPGASAPCPGLRIMADRAVCSLVVTEKAHSMAPVIALSLGIGYGCSMVDDDTTAEEEHIFNAASQARSNRDWAELRERQIQLVASR